jgi:cyanophycinase-like exopeptidase
MYKVSLKSLFFFLLLLAQATGYSQNYTSWLTGSSNDLVSAPLGGVCLMGGAGEDDQAMKWFLERCDGGDVLVIRATGADGYNNYLYSTLGVNVNSVETILFNNPSASYDSYVLDKIKKAEGIWIAGGDQWDYISYWRNTPVDSLINKGIAERNIVIGGISAGMAIQGKYYFSAENGSVMSATALSNPYSATVTVSGQDFIQNNALSNVITDTHYDNPDRKGRHIVFLARIYQDDQVEARGIACDEYTAVCIDENGIARVFGELTGDYAYFIQPNCELTDRSPETCSLLTPLTWDRGGAALKVYQINGNLSGDRTFNLNDWTTASGGVWKHWSVQNGALTESSGTAPNCPAGTISHEAITNTLLFPNPLSLKDEWLSIGSEFDKLEVLNLTGQNWSMEPIGDKVSLKNFTPGFYFIRISNGNKVLTQKLEITE